ncbi:peroxiredoxin [Sulfitobacter porphyrae]|uniref:Glutathione-dependent peroxiredoxin n=1 Tax=Sulfitobacter porphyrae TaxID=1246864 RepID=A0ABW2AZH9_9RHOB|nr:peroxiredoxin [Sulfitobacter porphyrae]
MKTGTRLPPVTFHTRIRDETIGGPNPYRWKPVTTHDLFAGKRSILIGLPGAFTPTCSTRQLPGFEALADDFRSQGIERIYCISVNDAFVMNRWAAHLGLNAIHMIPDGSGELTRKLGMLVHKDNLGFGLRSWRYAAVVDDGVIAAWFEEPGLCDNAADDPYSASRPEAVLDWLRRSDRIEAA